MTFHSFIPGLKHSFSTNPSHRSLPFLLLSVTKFPVTAVSNNWFNSDTEATVSRVLLEVGYLIQNSGTFMCNRGPTWLF